MNTLNQCILEAEVWDNPKISEENGKRMASVIVKYERTNNNREKEISYMTIVCYGNFADAIVEECRINRGLRVVGRLKQFSHKSDDGVHVDLAIVAEHIEFKQNRF